MGYTDSVNVMIGHVYVTRSAVEEWAWHACVSADYGQRN